MWLNKHDQSNVMAFSTLEVTQIERSVVNHLMKDFVRNVVLYRTQNI